MIEFSPKRQVILFFSFSKVLNDKKFCIQLDFWLYEKSVGRKEQKCQNLHVYPCDQRAIFQNEAWQDIEEIVTPLHKFDKQHCPRK